MPEPWGLAVLPDIGSDPRHSSGVLPSTVPKPQDQDDLDLDLDDANDSDGSDQPRREKARKPHLQGRFSGRLQSRADEKKVADECRLLGPLLGGVGKRGERSRQTLAKIVRSIASGEVRLFCEEREAVIQVGSSCPGIRCPSEYFYGRRISASRTT